VIPCFNARPWIEATLASVEAQTWRPLEIIVVDDGSTDGSGQWLEAQAASGRLQLLRQSNRGQTAALNAGMRLARGELLQFLDADDVLGPDKIKRQVDRLDARVDVVVTCEWGRFHGPDPASATFVPEPCWRDLAPLDWLAAAWHDGGGMLFPALWLVPRQVAEAAGPWAEDLSMNNDAEFFVRVVLAASEVRFCGGARAYYRSGVPGSMTSRIDSKALQLHHLALARIQSTLSDRLHHAGVRRGLSLIWQRYARFAFPRSIDLAEDAMRRASALHAATLPDDGGWRYRLLSRMFGWRTARRVQVWSGRL
jgi:glycosyltransferase involved in cell wall biosynthesis